MIFKIDFEKAFDHVDWDFFYKKKKKSFSIKMFCCKWRVHLKLQRIGEFMGDREVRFLPLEVSSKVIPLAFSAHSSCCYYEVVIVSLWKRKWSRVLRWHQRVSFFCIFTSPMMHPRLFCSRKEAPLPI